MQNCKDIQALISEYIDQELSAEQARLVEAHIAQCPACKKELEAVRKLTGILGGLKKDIPPDDFLTSVNARIKNRRSLDSVLAKILKNPDLRIPVTVSVLAIFLFIVADRAIKPYFFQKSRLRASANEIGEQYSPGLTAIDEASDKDFGGKTQTAVNGGDQRSGRPKGIESLNKEQWPVSQEQAPALRQELQAPSVVDYALTAKDAKSAEEKSTPQEQAPSAIAFRSKQPAQTSDGMVFDSLAGANHNVYPVVSEGAMSSVTPRKQAGQSDTVVINVYDVDKALIKVTSILKKYGIEPLAAQTGSTTQILAFTVTVPAALRADLIEELKKVSPDNVNVLLSQEAGEETCSMNVQLQKLTGNEPASASFTATEIK